MAERFIQSLDEALKALQTADHMTYITFPLVKEKRLMLKILSELNLAVLSTINAILQYEYYYKRIQIYSDSRENFNTFRKMAGRYEITPEQLKKIVEIISLAEKHKRSPFEFVKEDKIIILSDRMQTDTISIDKIKSFLIEVKDILKKANSRIKLQ